MSGTGQQRWLVVIGIGEDGIEGLSPAARALIANAKLVIGGKRHLALADGLSRAERKSWASPITDSIPEILKYRGEPVAVLASGDPYCYGIGSLLSAYIPSSEIIAIPAPSSLSLACAKLGWALDETATISLCGHPIETLAPLLQPNRHLLVLSTDATAPASVARYLRERGFGSSILHVLEALGGERERIRSTKAESYGFNDVDALNLVAIEIEAGADAKIIPLAAGVPDEMFEHDGQLTKREVRASTLSALAPRHGELLWDVGLGAGSIAIEWLLRHPSLKAIGIESEPERAARAARNAAALGTPDLEIVPKRAPEAFAGLPSPDAVFIGGGLSNPAVFEGAWANLKPGGRLVANAVSIQSEARLIEYFQHYGGDLVRLDVAKAGKAGTGSVFVWRSAAPIVQWRARKP
jgi:precorrin-6Y C5,15-methyltransferase (decarboxylating)